MTLSARSKSCENTSNTARGQLALQNMDGTVPEIDWETAMNHPKRRWLQAWTEVRLMLAERFGEGMTDQARAELAAYLDGGTSRRCATVTRSFDGHQDREKEETVPPLKRKGWSKERRAH